MSVNMGQAVGYLDLDTSKFKSGFKSALNDLKTFQSETATGKDKLSALGSAATSTGRSLTKGLTVPLLGIGTAAVAVTAKFDAGMSKVQAISGATSEDMEKLRAKAKEMGAQTKFSATESAEAFSYMAMAGWKTEDMLDGISGIMNLAAASGEDLATTSDIVTDAITAFGLKAEDSAHFADVLAAASSNANTNVSMMGETFKYVAPVAGALGFSVEDISTAIGLMANSGIKGSQAGTALRNIFTRMVKPTKQSAKVMEELGISITDSEGKMKSFDTIMGDLREGFASLSEAEKAQAASALAGQYGMSGLLAIVNSSDKDFNKLKDSIYNADGAAEDMAETMMDNLPGAITLAKSALEGLGIRIGEVITPAVTKVVRVFTSFISWLSQASDGTVRFAVVMGLILSAIGPVLLIVGAMCNGLVSMITLYNTLSGVLAGRTVMSFAKAAAAKLRDAVATTVDTVANLRYQASLRGGLAVITSMISRVLALAAAHKVATLAALGVVGAAIGLIIYMKKTGTSVDELKDKVVNTFNNIVKQLPEIMNTVSRVAVDIVRQLPSMISGLMSSLREVISNGLDSLKTIMPQVADWWRNDMPELIQLGADMLVNIINGFAETIPQLIDTQSTMIAQMIEQFFAVVPQFIEAGSQIILSIIQGVMTAVPQLIASLSAVLTNNIGPIISKVLGIMLLIANAIIANMPVILQSLATIAIALVKAIGDIAPSVLAAAVKIMAALAMGIIKSLPSLLVAVVKISAAIVQAILSIAASLVKAGAKIIQALWRGISSWAGKLRSNVRSMARRVFNAIVSGLGNLLSAGANWIAGLWNGIKGKIGSVISGVTSFAKSLPSKIRSGLGSLYSVGSNFIAGLANGALGRINSFISSLRSKLNEAKNLAKKIFKIGSPSKVMFQYGKWIIEGLENGMNVAFNPMFKSLDKNLNKVLELYDPIRDYDFGIGESFDNKLINKLDSMTPEGGLGSKTINMPMYLNVSGADNPEVFAEEVARGIKMRLRTV